MSFLWLEDRFTNGTYLGLIVLGTRWWLTAMWKPLFGR